MDDTYKIFDRNIIRLRRERAAKKFADYNFLKEIFCAEIASRLMDIRGNFPLCLDLGCHDGTLNSVIENDKVGDIIACDASLKMLRNAPVNYKVVMDEEFIPFKANVFDAVFASMNLHMVNDIPGCLIQINQCLKPDGLLLVTIPGVGTLKELRASLELADAEFGSACPRIAPLMDIRDIGGLLQRTGFALPVIDKSEFQISYSSPFKLFEDLRGMAETNALSLRHRRFSNRRYFMRVAEIYADQFSDDEGGVTVTVAMLNVTAFKSSPSQQKPLARGSAKISMKDVL